VRAASLLLVLVGGLSGWAAPEGAALIGTRAPAFRGITWVQGGPLTLEQLRGRPVLVRFWTDGCAYCRASAPGLSQLWRTYGKRGLVVIGVHHPKSPASRELEVVRRATHALGFEFPVGTDRDWETVRAYGVGRVFQSYTSVSVLIDGAGVIRWVHDGGALEPGSEALRALTAEIERELR
jgi:peroxiredoxin